MKLSALLQSNRGENLFLPAHGRGKALPSDLKTLLKKRAGLWDLPELPDLGDAISGHGEIALSQKAIASEFGVDRCWYGVNGATGLLQAAILSVARPGSAVLMPRNVHRSTVNACIFGDITPILFDLPFLEDRGHFSPPDLTWLDKVINEVNNSSLDLAAIVLVNPTYHGYSTDLEPLIRRIHLEGLPVLIDEAHGAHFLCSSSNLLPSSGVQVGADLVVHSLHKSSVGLAQTAVLWSQGDLVDPEAIERSITWLQTSSPSSLLLASCESSLKEWLLKKGQRRLTSLLEIGNNIHRELQLSGVPLLETQDPLKLVLHTSSKGINGFVADNWFIKKRIIAELPEPGTLTFCLGFFKHKGLVKLITNKWNDLLMSNNTNSLSPPFSRPEFPLISSPKVSSLSACSSKSYKVSLSESVGLISAQMICPYPPGIPLLIPGEQLDRNFINWISSQREFWPDQIPSEIKVLH